MTKLPSFPGIPSTEKAINEFIVRSLAEDVGDGDHTTLATIPASKTGQAKLLVKENGILAGVELARFIFKKADPKLKLDVFIEDGSPVKKGDIAFTIKGSSQKILTAERLVLNCMQRMSGIATTTARLTQLCKGTHAKLLDTRKTTPGFRLFEKWAVNIGGGENHRFGLYDMILIKDNHIDYAGGITQALQATRKYLKIKNKKLKIIVEARKIDDVKEILEIGGVHRILLDNFTPAEMKKAITLVNGRIRTEASGGITQQNILAYAKTGVDFISVGALTHSIKSLDLSLKAVKL